VGKITSISLSKAEVKRIEELMKAMDLKQHQVIKLAIRRFLFPKMKEDIPLDGAYARIVDGVSIEKDVPKKSSKGIFDGVSGVLDRTARDFARPHQEKSYKVNFDDEPTYMLVTEEEEKRRKAKAEAEKKRKIEEAMKKDGFL
jgi:Ribbon-helix-helix protein, copG family.